MENINFYKEKPLKEIEECLANIKKDCPNIYFYAIKQINGDVNNENNKRLLYKMLQHLDAK